MKRHTRSEINRIWQAEAPALLARLRKEVEETHATSMSEQAGKMDRLRSALERLLEIVNLSPCDLDQEEPKRLVAADPKPAAIESLWPADLEDIVARIAQR